MKNLLAFLLLPVSFGLFGQVDTSYIYNANKPYGTLDIRIAKSSTRYYYLQENKTFSFREKSPGVKTNTYRDMTSWDSSPYTEGNLRERNNTSDAFILNYRLLFPQGYQAGYSAGYPLIVMMHGAGERGNCWEDCFWADRSWNPASNNPAAPTDVNHQLLNNDLNLLHGGKQHLDARNLAGTRLPNDPALSARAFPGFVLFAQNLNGWTTSTTQDAIRLVRLVVKKYNIDPNRIYIHGLSNGGIAVYDAIKRAPWLFAAALPMSSPTDAGITSAGLQHSVANIPLWIFQGGQDTEPMPGRTEGYVRKFRDAGADVRYTLYENLGHGTWNAAYGEPDFFSWMRSKSKTQIHVFYGNANICSTSGTGVRMGLAAGFFAYQWEKDGVIISGATGNEYVATQPGVYRARFSRKSRTPSASQWESWSPAVTVTGSPAVKPVILPLTTTALRGPDNAGPNTIELKSSSKAEKYYWYKNGALINIPYNSQDDTVSIYSVTTTSTGYNGAYTLKTGTFGGCMSPASDPVNLYFNNSAPYLADSNVPASFRVVSTSGSTATLAWQDRSGIESAYEIWRRAPGEAFVMAGRTAANAQTFTDQGLLPSTQYAYKIRAVNNQGRSRYAPGDDVGSNLTVTTLNDTNAPSSPTNLRVVRNTISSISLAWTPSTDNNGAINHYVIYYGSQSKATNSSEPSYTLEGLPMNASYTITVKAVDNGGLFSPPSNQVTGTTSVTGLWYGHSTGAWTDLDQITVWNKPEYTGHVPNVTLAPRTQEDYFNFEFTGYLLINKAGSYYFYINSDDGSRLFIDGTQVVDFDGVHGKSGANDGYGVRSGAISLTAGPHAIRLLFFDYTGGQALTFAYQGADTDNQKQYVPDAALTSGNATGTSNQAPVVNITSPAKDQQYAEPASVNIAVTAFDPDGNVTKVEFFNGATKLGEDLSSPYAYAWNNVAAGSYTITAKATDNTGGTGSASVDITVTGGSGCAGAGKIQQELWTGISGTMISSILVNSAPTSVTDLSLFEGPANIGDNYGRRIRGYICVPVSGNYTFWISSNDKSELWLSTDANPANKRLIGSVDGYTNPRQWDKYPSQKSGSINLAANQRYYIEALHKEGVGTDHVAVGWQLPNGTLERPMPGMRLIPFEGGTPAATTVNITNPSNGDTFTAPASINITANASTGEGSITKVEFYNGTTKLGEDLSAPYSFAWNNVPQGSYALKAKATDDAGTAVTATVNVTVTGGTSACSGTGTVLREIWTGIQYNDVASIPVNESPDGVSELTIFEDPSNIGDNYGTRVSGYLCVPMTGAYTFWIASNDHSELWLSTDANPSNKRRIAYVTGYTNPREWTKYTSQQSASVQLVQGQRYYIEALHKEGVGSDHMAVGWKLPDGTLERPIPGNRLSPHVSETMTTFAAQTNTMMATEDTSLQGDALMEFSAGMEIYPNPADSGTPQLTISGLTLPYGADTKVEIQRMTGEIVYSRNFSCNGSCDNYSASVDQELPPGVYMVNVITEGRRATKRLLVK